MDEKKTSMKRNAVDIIKFICCIMIVASHCLPLFHNELINYYYGQWLFRFCVPFFFISTGYFFSKMDDKMKKKYILRIFLLYLFSSFLYLPLYYSQGIKTVVFNLLFGYKHLWYLSALTIGLIIITVLENIKNVYFMIILLAGGILLDEYYKLFDNTVLNEVANVTEYLGGARHALFFAIPLLLIGVFISNEISCFKPLQNFKSKLYMIFFVVLLGISFIEATYMHYILGNDITLDISLFGWMPAIPLFLFAISVNCSITYDHLRRIRKLADIIYIIHLWIRTLIVKYSDISYFAEYLVVLILSVAFALVCELIFGGRNKSRRLFQ